MAAHYRRTRVWVAYAGSIRDLILTPPQPPGAEIPLLLQELERAEAGGQASSLALRAARESEARDDKST